MLYVFHGSDMPQAVKKSHDLVASLRAKRPDASYVRIEADRWNPVAVHEHLGGQGLFSKKYIIYIDRVAESAEAREELAGLIPAMHQSENIFIVLEGKLNAELTRAFEKDADKMVACEPARSSAASGKHGAGNNFNIFALADALGSRDALKAWALYRTAVDAGFEPENVIGTLFWQTKSMMLGVRSSARYSSDELLILARDLVSLYHDSHRGLVDGEIGVERLLLNCGKRSV